MQQQQRSYAFGQSTLTIRLGDLRTSHAQVLVSSDDYYLSMGGGLSEDLLEAAGEQLARDAAKMVPAAAGDVIVTTAGNLPARYIFHAVTIGPTASKSTVDPAELVRALTSRCLELADTLRMQSIAFPALGTGTAQISIDDTAVEMGTVISEHLKQRSTRMDVELYLFDRFGQKTMVDYLPFFEAFARRLPDLPAARTAVRSSGSPRLPEKAHPARVFYSYAHKDDRWREQLELQLRLLERQGLIEPWSDRKIGSGDDWKARIDEHLETADLVLLLVSPAFLGSDYCYENEMQRALELHKEGKLRVVPIILHEVDWQGAPFSHIKALPKDGKPITSWSNKHKAWTDVARGIRALVTS